jgi:hypothetical protein
MFSELMNRFRKKNEPIVYNYRRFAVTTQFVGHSNTLRSNSLFPGHHPTRMYFAIVKSDAYEGTQKTSPYMWFHKWKYEKPSTWDDFENHKKRELEGANNAVMEMKSFLKTLSEALREENEEACSNPVTRSAKGKSKVSVTPIKSSKKSLADVLSSYFDKDMDDVASTKSGSSSQSKQSAKGSSFENEEVPLAQLRSGFRDGPGPSPPPSPAPTPVQLYGTVHLTKCALLLDNSEFGK